MFAAKAEDPGKYRELVTIVDSRDTKDLLDELRRAGEARPAVVDGESHIVEEKKETGENPGS